jgi:putative SOS response-associated peptidase YedK
MCERYSNVQSWAEMATVYGATSGHESKSFKPTYNAAPPQFQPILRERLRPNGSHYSPSVRELVMARFGLINSWLKKPRRISACSVNAKAEVVQGSPLYRGAFNARRCIVPATGWYAFERVGRSARQPWAVKPRDGVFAFAGLWTTWSYSKYSQLETFNIITTPAAHAIAHINLRMPCVLQSHEFDQWLGPDPEAVRALLKPAEMALDFWQIAACVSSSRYNDEQLLMPLLQSTP